MLPDVSFLIGLALAGVFLAISNNLGISLQPLICYDFEFCRNSCNTLLLIGQKTSLTNKALFSQF